MQILEQPAQYSNLRLCLHILVLCPSAMYALLMRMMLRYLTNSTTWSVLEGDVSQLVLHHLLGYTLETMSDEEDDEQENRRIDAAMDTIQEWGVQKEWGEKWMEDVLSRIVRGGDIEFPPECRACS